MECPWLYFGGFCLGPCQGGWGWRGHTLFWRRAGWSIRVDDYVIPYIWRECQCRQMTGLQEWIAFECGVAIFLIWNGKGAAGIVWPLLCQPLQFQYELHVDFWPYLNRGPTKNHLRSSSTGDWSAGWSVWWSIQWVDWCPWLAGNRATNWVVLPRRLG